MTCSACVLPNLARRVGRYVCILTLLRAHMNEKGKDALGSSVYLPPIDPMPIKFPQGETQNMRKNEEHTVYEVFN